MKNIKSLITKVLLSFVFVLGFTACEEDIFGKELYKKIFALLSDDEQIFSIVHPFAAEGSTRNISIICGGTQPLDEDVVIELELDNDSLLDIYNEREYGIEEDLFAKRLDTTRYKIANYKVTMKAGQADQYVTVPVNIKMDGLSPDSTYLIPIRIKSVSGNYDINEEKRSILYHPLMENDYAKQATASTYSSRIYSRDYKALGIGKHEYLTDVKPTPLSSTKIVYPIGENTVRVTLADNTSLDANGNPSLTNITNYSILITVGKDNKLNVTPYSDNIEIELLSDSVLRKETEQFEKDYQAKLTKTYPSFDWGYIMDNMYYLGDYYTGYYNNEYRIETGRQCFFLSYKYKFKSEKIWHRVQERLRRDE